MPAFTYILFSEKLNKYYIGSTENINQRLLDHNQRKSPYTSTGIPWVIKYFEEFSTLSQARKRELQIKNKKSRRYIEYLINSSAD